ncbi:MAG: PRC-barrel domain-containing protein [Stellaceae bacterium]
MDAGWRHRSAPVALLLAALGFAVAAGSTPVRAGASTAPVGSSSQTTALQRVPQNRLMPILGKDVVSATGETMGPIVDVLFEGDGKPRAAVIDFGGFLGVGTRKIAIDWSALLFDMGDKKNVIALDISRAQLEAAPEYQGPDKPISIVTLPHADAGGAPPATAR